VLSGKQSYGIDWIPFPYHFHRTLPAQFRRNTPDGSALYSARTERRTGVFYGHQMDS
jgi:hypothetical protein